MNNYIIGIFVIAQTQLTRKRKKQAQPRYWLLEPNRYNAGLCTRLETCTSLLANRQSEVICYQMFPKFTKVKFPSCVLNVEYGF